MMSRIVLNLYDVAQTTQTDAELNELSVVEIFATNLEVSTEVTEIGSDIDDKLEFYHHRLSCDTMRVPDSDV
jgi:hypothetical protein